MTNQYQIPPGVGLRVVVDGEFYTVDEFIEGDPVLRPEGEHGGVRSDADAPTVEIHQVPMHDAELYTFSRADESEPPGEGSPDLCPECKAAMRHHEQGFCPYEIETGERFMESELTGETYRVTRWVERGEGKVISLQKEPAENGENQQKASR